MLLPPDLRYECPPAHLFNGTSAYRDVICDWGGTGAVSEAIVLEQCKAIGCWTPPKPDDDLNLQANITENLVYEFGSQLKGRRG